jgi:hypothetical protein
MITCSQVYSTTALLRIEVELVSYNNPTSEVCEGGNCEGAFGTCDNHFSLCVREVGTSLCLVTLSSINDIEDDSLTFSISELDELGLGNPLRFNSVRTTVSVILLSQHI